MPDRFATQANNLGGPFIGGFPITKSDVTVFAQPTRAIWVGGVGDLAVRYIDGTTDVLKAVPAGTLLFIRADKVLDTGTTATNISGLY